MSNPDHTFSVSSPDQLHTKSKCIDMVWSWYGENTVLVI